MFHTSIAIFCKIPTKVTNGTLIGIPKNKTSSMVPFGTTVAVNCFEGFVADKPGNSTCTGIYLYISLNQLLKALKTAIINSRI